MSKPPKVEDEPGAEERFERGLKNALATPHKPHKGERHERRPKERED